MKKIFTIMAVLICFGISANAQELRFGLKGGWNSSAISSFYAGVFFESWPCRHFGVSPEIVYSRQGVVSGYLSSVPFYSISTYSVTEGRLDYLNIPILLKIYPIKWFSIDLGPQIGFLIASDTETKSNDTSDGPNFSIFDLSLAMGLTINLGNHVLIQGRYNMGLTNIFEKDTSADSASPGGFGSQTNQVAQLGVGYRF